MIVSWITPSEPGSNTVLYWKANTTNKYKAEGIVTSYKFINYTSGHIHHCTIKDLEVLHAFLESSFRSVLSSKLVPLIPAVGLMSTYAAFVSTKFELISIGHKNMKDKINHFFFFFMKYLR